MVALIAILAGGLIVAISLPNFRPVMAAFNTEGTSSDRTGHLIHGAIVESGDSCEETM